jgi:hypothetical protein
MQRDAGAFVEGTIRTAPRSRTYLCSETAPDSGEIRRRLVETRAASRRRKHYATCAAAVCTLLAVVRAQGAGGAERSRGSTSEPTS